MRSIVLCLLLLGCSASPVLPKPSVLNRETGVARVLRSTAQSPCPIRPGLWAMADLHVSARDPNVPQKSLPDMLKKP